MTTHNDMPFVRNAAFDDAVYIFKAHCPGNLIIDNIYIHGIEDPNWLVVYMGSADTGPARDKFHYHRSRLLVTVPRYGVLKAMELVTSVQQTFYYCLYNRVDRSQWISTYAPLYCHENIGNRAFLTESTTDDIHSALVALRSEL